MFQEDGRLSENETVSIQSVSKRKIDKCPEAQCKKSIKESGSATKSIPDKLLTMHLTRIFETKTEIVVEALPNFSNKCRAVLHFRLASETKLI